ALEPQREELLALEDELNAERGEPVVGERCRKLVGRCAEREDEPLARIDRLVPGPLRADPPPRRDTADVLDELAGREGVRDRRGVTEAVRHRATRERDEVPDHAYAKESELLDDLRVEREHVERERIEERALVAGRDLTHRAGRGPRRC